jgi:hypothetical protein
MKPLTIALLSLLAGFVGGVVGAAGVHLAMRDRGSPAADDDADRARLAAAVAALERRLAPPGLAAGAPEDGAGRAAPPAPASPGIVARGDVSVTTSKDGRVTLSADEIRLIASEAADAALEKRSAKEKEAEKAEARKKATLAEASRELGLSAAQENELRAAYAEATEKYVKLFAEPEQTPDELRRELESIRNDPAKKTALTIKMMPKLMSKLGDVMAVEAAKEARVTKAVGTEKMAAYRKFKIAEEDPFGFDEDDSAAMTFGLTTGD